MNDRAEEIEYDYDLQDAADAIVIEISTITNAKDGDPIEKEVLANWAGVHVATYDAKREIGSMGGFSTPVQHFDAIPEFIRPLAILANAGNMAAYSVLNDLIFSHIDTEVPLRGDLKEATLLIHTGRLRPGGHGNKKAHRNTRRDRVLLLSTMRLISEHGLNPHASTASEPIGALDYVVRAMRVLTEYKDLSHSAARDVWMTKLYDQRRSDWESKALTASRNTHQRIQEHLEIKEKARLPGLSVLHIEKS